LHESQARSLSTTYFKSASSSFNHFLRSQLVESHPTLPRQAPIMTALEQESPPAIKFSRMAETYDLASIMETYNQMRPDLENLNCSPDSSQWGSEFRTTVPIRKPNRVWLSDSTQIRLSNSSRFRMVKTSLDRFIAKKIFSLS
jgi:hypothetical protein